jgi:hypothetical protein
MKKYNSIPNFIFNIILRITCFLVSLTCIYNISDLLLATYIKSSNIIFTLVFFVGIIVSVFIGRLLCRLLGHLQSLE